MKCVLHVYVYVHEYTVQKPCVFNTSAKYMSMYKYGIHSVFYTHE